MRGTTTRRTNRWISTAFLVVAVASSLTLQTQNVPTSAASREPVRARHGMVASTNEIASNVGVDVMKRDSFVRRSPHFSAESDPIRYSIVPKKFYF